MEKSPVSVPGFLCRVLAVLIFTPLVYPLAAQNTESDSIRLETYFNQLGQHCYSNLDSTQYYLDLILQATTKAGLEEERTYAFLWGILCTGYHDQIDLKYQLLQQAAAYLAENDKKLSPEVLAATDLDLQMHWGDYYMETGGYNGALDIYEALASGLENKAELNDDEFQRLVICYQYLASIHKQRGSHQEAIDYYFRALHAERRYYAERGNTGRDESLAHSRIAGAYWLMGAQKQAMAYYRSAFNGVLKGYQAATESKSRVRKRLISLGLEIGSNYLALEKPDSALYYLEQVTPFSNPGDPITQELRLEKAKAWSKKGQFSRALDTLQRAIAALQPEGSALLPGKLLNGQGDIFQAQGAYRQSLQSYQEALRHLGEDFSAADLHQNPTASAWIAPRELLYTLRQKTRLLLWRPPDDSRQWLHSAWATAAVAMDLVDSIKVSYTSDYDKQYLLEDSYDLYELALQIAHRLGPEYAGPAFQVMEKSRSIALFAAVRDLHARTFARVPKEDLEKMQRLRYQLKKAETELEQAGTEAQQIAQRDKRLRLQRDYQALIRSFERDYPEYYQLKYGRQAGQWPAILGNTLSDDQLLVSYFIGEKQLYVSVIDGGAQQARLLQLPWSKELSRWATELKDDIYQGRDEAYRNKAYALYQALLAPVLDGRRAKHLLVIPDGVLGYLPFDILLTQPPSPEEAGNYRHYPFLLRQTAVSQHFSLALLQEMEIRKADAAEDLLALAPTFSGADYAAGRNDRAVLGELLFNAAEATSVLQWFKGKLVTAREATKEQFLQLAPQFSIYHIASHAVVDDEAPNRSFIAFTAADTTTQERSRLYSYEILAQSFPADLIVLSACETGLGKIVRGEGIMSLARAFSYAGARSLVTSLWNINDQSSAELMSEFYRLLKAGLPKDEALRQAKLAYLENAPDNARAHPQYWAAFIPTGDMKPLQRSTPWKWGLLAAAAVAIGAWVFRRQSAQAGNMK